MVSYREALADLLSNETRLDIAQLLRSGESPFSKIKSACDIEHGEVLTRHLRSLESLGVVDHSYHHGSEQVYSFYSLTPFGQDVVQKIDNLASSTKDWPSSRRVARKSIKSTK